MLAKCHRSATTGAVEKPDRCGESVDTVCRRERCGRLGRQVGRIDGDRLLGLGHPLLGLGALASGSEIIVMRSSGLSVGRLARMVALSGFVLLVLTALLGEFIGPPLDFYARDMRMAAR